MHRNFVTYSDLQDRTPIHTQTSRPFTNIPKKQKTTYHKCASSRYRLKLTESESKERKEKLTKINNLKIYTPNSNKLNMIQMSFKKYKIIKNNVNKESLNELIQKGNLLINFNIEKKASFDISKMKIKPKTATTRLIDFIKIQENVKNRNNNEMILTSINIDNIDYQNNLRSIIIRSKFRLNNISISIHTFLALYFILHIF